MRTHVPSMGRGWTTAVIVWSAAAGGGTAWLWRAAAQAGEQSVARGWPAGSALNLDPSRITLVVFAHPACQHAQSTMKELAEVLAGRQDRAVVHVIFAPGEKLEQSDAWQLAQKLEGADVRVDPDGSEIHRFGARTSGQILAFDPRGTLLFRGGITAGRDRLVARLAGVASDLAQAPVFGCALTTDR